MKKMISAVFGSNAKSDNTMDLDCPHTGYYGGLLNQGAYGK
jgi:hypothetical protein